MPSPIRYLPFLGGICLLYLIGWVLMPYAHESESLVTTLEATCNNGLRQIAFVRTPLVSVFHEGDTSLKASAFCIAMVPKDNADSPEAFEGEKFCIYFLSDVNGNGEGTKFRDNKGGSPGPVNYQPNGDDIIAGWFNGSQQLCEIKDQEIRTSISQELDRATGTTSINDVLEAVRQDSVDFGYKQIPFRGEGILTGEIAFIRDFGSLIYQVIDSTLEDVSLNREAAARINDLSQKTEALGEEIRVMGEDYESGKYATSEDGQRSVKVLQQRAISLQQELNSMLADDAPIVLWSDERTTVTELRKRIVDRGSRLERYEGVISTRSWADKVVVWIGGEGALEESKSIIRILFFSLFSAIFGVLLCGGVVLLITYHRRLNKGVGNEERIYHDLFLELQSNSTGNTKYVKELDALLDKYKPTGEAKFTGRAIGESRWGKWAFWRRKRNGSQQKDEIKRLRAFYHDFEIIREKIYALEEISWRREGNSALPGHSEKLFGELISAQKKLAKALGSQEDPGQISVVASIEKLVGRLDESENECKKMTAIVELFSLDETTGKRITLDEAKMVASDIVEIAKVFLKSNPVAEQAVLKQAHRVALETAGIGRVFLGDDLTVSTVDNAPLESRELAQGAVNIAKAFLGKDLNVGQDEWLGAQISAKESFSLHKVVREWMSFDLPEALSGQDKGVPDSQDDSHMRQGESGTPGGRGLSVEDVAGEGIILGRVDSEKQGKEDEAAQVRGDTETSAGESAEERPEVNGQQPAIGHRDSFSQRLDTLFKGLNAVGESHLGMPPGRKTDPQILVSYIEQGLEERKRVVADYEQLQQVERQVREILTKYTITSEERIEYLAKGLGHQLDQTIDAIQEVITDSDKGVEEHDGAENMPVKSLVERLILNRASVVNLASKLSTYLNMPAESTLGAATEANSYLRQLEQEGDEHRQLRLRLSAALIALHQASEKVRSKDRAVVLKLLQLEDITTGLVKLLQILGKLPGEKLWSIGIANAFSEGWLHRLFRAELILKTYYSTGQPLYEPIHQAGEALRQAMGAFGVELKPAITLLEEPPKGAETLYNAHPLLYAQEEVKKKVRERIDAGGITFVVDVEAVPYQEFRGKEPYAGHVVLVNPSEWN